MRKRDQRGAAAVEFALVSMLLVTLLMGIIEFGYAFFVQGNIAGAAREAARVYAIGGQSDQAVSAAVDAGSAINLASSMVSIPAGACPLGAVGQSVKVTVTYPYTGLTGFFPYLVELRGQGTMRCNG